MKRLCSVLAVLLLTLSLTGILAAASPVQDLNADGAVDKTDLEWLLGYLVGNTDLPEGVTEEDLDLNGNGELDIFDAVLVLQYIQGVIPQLPSSGNGSDGEQKVPEGLSSLVEGAVYRFGETFCGYGSYVIVGEDGQALMAVPQNCEPITDGKSTLTNCFLMLYRVSVGSLTETRSVIRSADIALNPETVCNVALVVGGSEEDREYAKDLLRTSVFDYDELCPEEQAYVDAILNGEAFEESSVDTECGYETYRAVLSQDGTVASLTLCVDGEEAGSYGYAYEDGRTVRMDAYDAEGGLQGYVTYSYHEDGMLNASEIYAEDGSLIAVTERDQRGNTVKTASYDNGVLRESQRFEYVYDTEGTLVKVSSYYAYGQEPEVLLAQIEWDEGNVRMSNYYSDGTLQEEQIFYADGREECKRYEGNGLLYFEAAYDADGNLEYRREYDQGELMFEERAEWETTEGGNEIKRTYCKENGGEEYLASETTYFADGSYQCKEHDSTGALQREYGETADRLWWEKYYENGVLREEGGSTENGYFSRIYDEEGNLVEGFRQEDFYEDGQLLEQLEYVFTVETGEYLSVRREYEADGSEKGVYHYNPDGSLESRAWTEVYTEDNAEIRARYEQYGDAEPILLYRNILYADGGWRYEQYEEGDITYIEGLDAEGNYYYSNYEYWETENGKYLAHVYSRYEGKGYSDIYYYEDGSLESEDYEYEDGSGYHKSYDPGGVLIYHYQKSEDGSSFSKQYYEDGSLQCERISDKNGDVIREISYAPDGSVTFGVRFEYEYSEDGELLVRREYVQNAGEEEYLSCIKEYTESGYSVAYYEQDGSLLEKERYESVYDEETGINEERIYKQYEGSEEFLYSLAQYDEHWNLLYSIQMDEDGDPIYEERLSEDGWGYDTKELDYDYDSQGNKYLAAYYENYSEGGYRETYYLPDGTVVYDHYYYYDGRYMTYEKEFHDNGNVSSERYHDNDMEWWKYYYESGALRSESYSNEDGSREEWSYFENGVPSSEHHTAADGSYWGRNYFEDGSLLQESERDEKDRVIRLISYLEDGSITEHYRFEYVDLADGGYRQTEYRLNEGGEEYIECEEIYNANGVLRGEKRYRLNEAGEAVLVREYAYDALGNYTAAEYGENGDCIHESQMDAAGNGYAKFYTEEGVLTGEEIFSAEKGVTYLEYDEDGNVISYRRWETLYDDYGNENGNLIYVLDENGDEYLSEENRREGDISISVRYESAGNATNRWEDAPDYQKIWEYAQDENGVWYLDNYRCFWADGRDDMEKYYPNGNLKQMHSLDAENDGVERLYYESGALWYERTFDGDVETYISYDEEGNVEEWTCSTYLYEATYYELHVYTRVSDGGEYLSRLERYYEDGASYGVEYYADGTTLMEFEYDSEGTGYSKWYHPNGVLSSETYYEMGTQVYSAGYDEAGNPLWSAGEAA